jgi:transcriptional regulator with XRE-family HTH domain
MSLGSKLTELRERQGMDRRQLADAAGVDVSYIGHLERGARQIPSRDVLKALARALRCSATELLAAAMEEELTATPTPAPTDEPPVIIELGRDRHISPHTREMLKRVVLDEYEKWKRDHPEEANEGRG